MTRQYHACENFQVVPEKDVVVVLGVRFVTSLTLAKKEKSAS